MLWEYLRKVRLKASVSSPVSINRFQETVSLPAFGDKGKFPSKFMVCAAAGSKIHPNLLLVRPATPLLRALRPLMPGHGSLLRHLIHRKRKYLFANGLRAAHTLP
jgi:hypothetical protein